MIQIQEKYKIILRRVNSRPRKNSFSSACVPLPYIFFLRNSCAKPLFHPRQAPECDPWSNLVRIYLSVLNFLSNFHFHKEKERLIVGCIGNSPQNFDKFTRPNAPLVRASERQITHFPFSMGFKGKTKTMKWQQSKEITPLLSFFPSVNYSLKPLT